MTVAFMKRTPCEEPKEGCYGKMEYWNDTSRSQEMPKIAGKTPKAKKAKRDSPTGFRRSLAC